MKIEVIGPRTGKYTGDLLSAAPVLLQLVSEMLGAAELDCLDERSNTWRSLMIDARAAIKKATGENP
jgi:hypothetical protein